MARRYAAYQRLIGDARLRQALQLALARLDSDIAAYLVEVLFGPPPSNLPHQRLLHGWSLCCIASLAVMLPLGMWWILAVVVTVNVIVLHKVPFQLQRNTEALILGPALLAVADRLGSVQAHDALPELTALHEGKRGRSRGSKELRWLTLLSDSSTPWGGFALGLNWLFLGQLVVYSRVMRKFLDYRDEWASTFELVASVDAAIAVANFLHRTPSHCPVTLADDATIAIEDGYHPFLDRPVLNSVNLTRRSALITGSNMTGKTTYLKMIGINIVLGHTLGFCLARSATLPPSPVMVSVRNDQSVESGRSGYSSEVEAIGEFVKRAEAGECRIFIMDEPFRGTNTVERIAVAKAVLDALSADAQVLAATHDVELQHLLAGRFDFFYFREDPDVDGFFDFKVRSGTSRERNAIRVLARMGFPSQIVRAALDQVAKMSDSGAEEPPVWRARGSDH